MKVNRRAFKRAVWSSTARLISTALAAGSGSLIHQLLGDGLGSWGIALGMAVAAFIMMLGAAYKFEEE